MNGARFKRMLSMIAGLVMAATASDAATVKILALGTSLTQGLGVPPGLDLTAVLETRLKASGFDVKFINAGVSGDTSAGGMALLDWSLAEHPQAAIIELGSNDALRGQAPGETEKNLSAIIARLKSEHVSILLTGMKSPRNLGPEYAAQFDAIYPKLAKEYGVLFYPFILDGVAANPKLNQADGIHPNPAGVKIIADRMLPYVKRLVLEVKR
jgi:acyl-CoA thioesterase-1